MKAVSPLYYRHRFPGAIISHCVWLYHRFSLSLRDIAELMAKDGIQVSHETIRGWCRKFGSIFAGRLQYHRPPPADRWHCDEMQLKMNRTTHYLWHAVDRDGLVLGPGPEPQAHRCHARLPAACARTCGSCAAGDRDRPTAQL